MKIKSERFRAGEGKKVRLKQWPTEANACEGYLRATSTDRASWYVVPADGEENARLIISQMLLDPLKSLKLSYPEISMAHRVELQATRRLPAK